MFGSSLESYTGTSNVTQDKSLYLVEAVCKEVNNVAWVTRTVHAGAEAPEKNQFSLQGSFHCNLDAEGPLKSCSGLKE